MSDALSALRGALTPAKGMRRIPFPTESYQHPSAPLSAKRLLNLMAEQEPADARTQAALISTPGLVSWMTLGTGPILALNDDLSGRLYVVSGTHFFRLSFISGPPLVEDMGDIGTPTRSYDFVSIAVGVLGAVVCVPPNAFTCPHGGGSLNQIGGTFAGAASVAYLDGYFAFTDYSNNNAGWFICGLLDPTAFDALDFASADGVPNVLRRIISHRGELWLMGEGGQEVWYDSGDLDFPFRRRAGSVIPIGMASPTSVATGDGSVWWVGYDNTVYRTSGYQVQRVSTHAIEAIIGANAPQGSVVNGLTYTQGGHSFYVVTAGSRTLVYDCNTKAWHDRSSSADGSGPWRAHSFCNQVDKFGDILTGDLWTPVMGTATEGGVLVPRQFTMPPIYAGTNRAFENALEIEMEVGTAESNGAITLETSDDGGTTWKAPRTLNAGAVGALRQRVRTTRLGSFHQRIHRITMTGAPTFFAVDADITGPPTTSGG